MIPTRLYPRLASGLAVLAAASALAASTAGAATTPLAAVGSAAPQPAGAQALGAVAQSQALSLDVFLRPRDPAALRAFDVAVSTPGSPDYHRFLAAGQFAGRFGPLPGTIAAVQRALRAAGLQTGTPTRDGLAIPVSGTAAQVSTALQTHLERFQLPGGQRGFANTDAPHLPRSIASDVQTVTGLDGIARVRPELAGQVTAQTSGVPTACSAAAALRTSEPGSLTIDQVAGAYGADPVYALGDLGQGTTVAVYELENNFPSDIGQFESCFGIPTGNVGYEQVDGGPGQVTSGDGVETELDIENVLGVAPDAHVIVYQGPYWASATNQQTLDVYHQMITDDSAQVITTSWGLCESQLGASDAQAENTLFQEAAGQGQSVFAASGDDGSEDCTNARGNPIDQLAVDDPGSQPWVTGAGGTSLTLGTGGAIAGETVWNNSYGGGGGGISSLWTMPAYQSTDGAQTGATTVDPGDGNREVPDVAADADPDTGYIIDYDGSWEAVGGTSGAAPLWAGIAALTESCVLNSGPTRLGQLNYALYPLAATDDAGAFSDITSGNNDVTGEQLAGGVHQYTARSGYDLASGLGSPRIGGDDGLVARLCGEAAPASVPTVGGVSPNSATLSGGTVTIQGTGFYGAPTVSFGGAAGTDVSVMSPDELSVLAPTAEQAGSVPVSVTTAGGTSTQQVDFTYGSGGGDGGGGTTTTTTTTTTTQTTTTGNTVTGQTTTQISPPPPAPTTSTGATTVAPPAPPASKATVPAFAAGGLTLALRQSGSKISLGNATCPNACNFDVRVYAPKVIRSHGVLQRERVQIGVLRVSLHYDTHSRLVVKLSAAGRALLRREHRFTATVSIKTVAITGRTTTVTRTLVLT
ncbi:MAG TPA: protease pro-enzyme activation domain-containing protein [Solirubrobacteraceae bacterium]|nr:protease pro-enzyme activation domain-containing protein [Solirubrobacteraceae bacterium]